MSISGRVTIDALFHDTDGDLSLKVLSLQGTQDKSSGKVALVTNTASGSVHIVPLTPSTYRDASGTLVTFAVVTQVVAKANSGTVVVSAGESAVTLQAGEVAAVPTQIVTAMGDDIEIYSTGGTASYTLILAGT